MMVGRIFAEWWVSCGKCHNAVPLLTNDKRVTFSLAHDQGYHRNEQFGFLCKSCRADLTTENQVKEKPNAV
jgi:hypothetical protein